jgi:glucokinase
VAVLGLDVGSVHVRLLCLDTEGRLLADATAPHQVDSCPDHVLDGVCRLVLDSAVAELPLKLGACAVTGTLHRETHGVVTAPRLTDFASVPLGTMLCDRLLVPMKVETAPRYALLGEGTEGAAKGARDWLLFDLGPSFGAAAVLDGRTPEADDPFPLGVLAAEAVLAPARRATSAALSDRYLLATGERADAREIAVRAARGQPQAADAVRRCGEDLGQAVLAALELAPLAKVVVTGGAAALGEALLRPAREAVETRRGKAAPPVAIVAGALHPYSAAWGAALDALAFLRAMK